MPWGAPHPDTGYAVRTPPTHALFAQVPDGYVSVDLDGVVLEWNAAAEAMFGWSRAEVRAGDLGDLLLNSRRAALHRRQVGDFRSTRVSGLLGRHAGVPMSTRDGRLLRVDCLVWSATDDRCETTLHCLMDDVTARHHEAVHMRRAVEDVGAFSAAMAHDLRVPLTAVKGYAELLRDHLGPDADAAAMVDRIDSASDRGVALIRDILDFLGVGRALAVREPVDLGELVRAVVAEQLEPPSRAARVAVHALPTVIGDRRLLAQLVGNLVGNALKYVPTGRDVEITVDAVLDVTWDVVVLRVHDNGDPIAEADRRRIFTMFQRGHGSTGAVAGTGVGLAVSQRIAELHDGGITVEIPADGGNRFCVQLGG